MNETDLILESAGQTAFFPPYSARECTQVLTPIAQGEWRRTVMGDLVHVGGERHRKFHTLIHCKDRVPPAFGDLWIGSRLRVGCLQSLTQGVAAGTTLFQAERPLLSFVLSESAGKRWEARQKDRHAVEIFPHFPGGFLIYRPWLMMRVLTYQLETDEWGLAVGWRLEMEEE